MDGPQVRVLYDFEGQEGTGELTIYAEDILTVLNQDVGEGWWEGMNQHGIKGLFPASYVEVMTTTSHPPDMPPPPLPYEYDKTEGVARYGDEKSVTQYNQPASNYDDWDDDWDDDNESTTADQPQPRSLSGPGNFGLSVPNRDARSSSVGDTSLAGERGDPTGKATVRKNFNRFSVFVKSGGEAYILGDINIQVENTTKVKILKTNDGRYMWAPNPNPYSCEIADHKKESKLKGLKSFIAYQISPSFATSNQVNRRFKQFDWLHHRLEEKFTLIPIPPLPDKQISGRYEGSFIKQRKAQLQGWVNRIVRHPVLSQCSVWMHFITCGADEKSWKHGKRLAERDDLTGAAFCYAIDAPEELLNLPEVEMKAEQFHRFVKNMDESIRTLQSTVLDQIKKHTGPYKREFLKIGHSFRVLSDNFGQDDGAYSRELTVAIQKTSETYREIATLYEEQPSRDLEPMSEVLHEYKGMLTAFPDIIGAHRSAMHKRKEFERLATENKVDKDRVFGVQNRSDVVSYAVLAEINHFQHERVTDFNQMMQSYLREQITFYEKITDKLRGALTAYEQSNQV